MDVQAAQIQPENLAGYDPGEKPFAAELPGIADLASLRLDQETGPGTAIEPAITSGFERSAAELRKVIAQALEIEWTPSRLSEREELEAIRWERERFLSPSWTARR